MEWKYVIIGLAGLYGLYLVGTVMYKPLKFLIRLIAWAMVGTVLLFIINIIFGHFGYHIAINPVTVLTAGILQLPGVVMMVIANYFLMG